MPSHRSSQDCACFNLRAATRSITQRYDEALAPSGLLCTQMSMLNVIDGHDVIGVAELANWMSMDVSTATKNLRPLISSGYITLKQSESDGRRREIRMTAKGKRALGVARPLWSKQQDQIVAQLGPRKFDQLLSLLSELRPGATR